MMAMRQSSKRGDEGEIRKRRRSDAAFAVKSSHSPAILALTAALLLHLLACIFTEYDLDANFCGNFWEPLHYSIFSSGGIANFEWNPIYAIRSPLVFFPLAILGRFLTAVMGMTNKLHILFILRAACSIFLVLSSAVLFVTAQRRLNIDKRALLLGWVVLMTNQHCLTFSSQISLDSFVVAANCLITAAWMDGRAKTAIWLGAMTTLLRPNFGVICLSIGLHLVLRPPLAPSPSLPTPGSLSSSKSRFLSNLAHLIKHGVLALVSCTLLVTAIDSWWYGRITLSTLNFLSFNVMEGGSVFFGSLPLFFFVDKMFLDNTAIVTGGGVVGILLSRHRVYAVPSVMMLVGLCAFKHKEERFLFPVIPIFAFMAGLGLDELLKIGSNAVARSRSVSAKTIRLTTVAIATLAVVISIVNGLGNSSFRASIYTPHHSFWLQAHAAVLPHSTCLTSFPWSSWMMPLGCEKVFCSTHYEEHFPSYNSIAYTRFTNHSESALHPLLITPSSILYRDWHDAGKEGRWEQERLRIARLHKSGVDRVKDGRADKIAAEIDYIFLIEPANAPFPDWDDKYRNATGGLEPEKANLILHYHELMLGGKTHLSKTHAVIAEARSLAHPFQFSLEPLERLLALWPIMEDEVEKSRVVMHRMWGRGSR